jgi:uncharacterized protein (UPF0332 family)/predicted nucleotidyltransferase
MCLFTLTVSGSLSAIESRFPLKVEALKSFVDQLLRLASESVCEIVLIGSVAKGEARETSDVDLLVTYAGDVSKVREATSQAGFETALEHGEIVESHLISIHDLRLYPWLFHEARKHGRVIYRMKEEELRRIEAKELLDLAEEFLDEAKDACKRGRFRSSIDQGCNAIELAMKALMIVKEGKLPSSHGGIVQRFGKLFVVTGEVSRDFGKLVNHSLELRGEARYNPKARPTEEDSILVISAAKNLIELSLKHVTS